MIYLIGGTPRTGKTTLAQMILERKQIPFVPTDVLTHALDCAYPKLSIRSDGWGTIPDMFYPYLREFVKWSELAMPNYVIEGDSFFPKHAHRLSGKFEIKSVFLGTSDIRLEDILAFAGHNDWVKERSKQYQKQLPQELVKKSAMIKKGADKYDIPYFDMAPNRKAGLEAAYASLFS